MRGQSPTAPSAAAAAAMSPWLLLALALLGSASAHRPGAPEDPEDEEAAAAEAAQCPSERDATHLTLPASPGAATFRYVIVRRCRTFRGAQAVCRRCYRGRLASVHSFAVNRRLQRCARARTNRGQVWIGGIVKPLGRNVYCQWVDHTVWNYAHWLHGYPRLLGTLCTSLCTANGRWRSVHCSTRLPFICEY